MRLLIPLIALIALLHAAPAQAEADKVRIVQPYGVIYLPSYVVADHHLIEREAEAMEQMERDILAALGLPDPY